MSNFFSRIKKIISLTLICSLLYAPSSTQSYFLFKITIRKKEIKRFTKAVEKSVRDIVQVPVKVVKEVVVGVSKVIDVVPGINVTKKRYKTN